MSSHECSGDKYHFETFESDSSSFDSEFSSFLNSKYSSGLKYKECQFDCVNDRRQAYCLFKKKH
jgi:hypothetical protein